MASRNNYPATRRRPEFDRTCTICGAAFRGHPNADFCSPECTNARRRAKRRGGGAGADPDQLPAGCRAVIDPDDPRRSVVPGYAARDDGTVLRRTTTGKWVPLRVKVGKHDFHRVRLVIDGREREVSLAATILRAFVGPRPLGCDPLHFPDTDPANNRADNLRWAPVGASKVGRLVGSSPPPAGRGDANSRSALAESEVPTVRQLYRAGFSYYEIADRMDAVPETIRRILAGETHAHVPDPLGPIVMRRPGPRPEDSPFSRLAPDEVAEIRGHHAAGLKPRVIAGFYGVSTATVRDIIKGRTWKEG